MNKQISAKDMLPTTVTTGPLSGSRKVYSAPSEHYDVNVAFREIALIGVELRSGSMTRLGPTPILTGISTCGAGCRRCVRPG